jgi:hypothetical protein
MNLTGIISISGKPGLYRVVAQGNNNVIVASLEDGKRMPAHSNNRISALDDISIYTYNEDIPLKEVLTTIYKKENGGPTISHKESAQKLVAYMLEILPEYDQERVYASDLKKLFNWYNMLHKANALVLEDEKTEEETGETKEKAAVKKTAKKSVSPDKVAKTSAKGNSAAKSNTKQAPVKKATTQKKNG